MPPPNDQTDEGSATVGPTIFLSASLFLGQIVEAEVRFGGMTTHGHSPTYTRSGSSTGGWTVRSSGWVEDRVPARFGERIGRLFGIRSSEDRSSRGRPTAPFETDEPGIASGEPMPVVSPMPVAPSTTRTMPVGPEAIVVEAVPGGKRLALSSEITIEVLEPAARVEATPTKIRRGGTIDARFASRAARSEDYHTVTGQLRIAGGQYQLHYAVADQGDPLGGIVVLELGGDLSALQDGDLVTVQGSVQRTDGAIPVYRPTVIQILERR